MGDVSGCRIQQPEQDHQDQRHQENPQHDRQIGIHITHQTVVGAGSGPHIFSDHLGDLNGIDRVIGQLPQNPVPEQIQRVLPEKLGVHLAELDRHVHEPAHKQGHGGEKLGPGLQHPAAHDSQ